MHVKEGILNVVYSNTINLDIIIINTKYYICKPFFRMEWNIFKLTGCLISKNAFMHLCLDLSLAGYLKYVLLAAF